MFKGCEGFAVLPMAICYLVRQDGSKVRAGEKLIFRSVHVVYCAKTFEVLPETSVCFELTRDGGAHLVSYKIEYLIERMATGGIVPVAGGIELSVYKLSDEGQPFKRSSYVCQKINGWDNFFAMALPESKTVDPAITHYRSEETECRFFCSETARDQTTNLSGEK